MTTPRQRRTSMPNPPNNQNRAGRHACRWPARSQTQALSPAAPPAPAPDPAPRSPRRRRRSAGSGRAARGTRGRARPRRSCPRSRRARARAPRRTRCRGCRWARRAAAGCAPRPRGRGSRSRACWPPESVSGVRRAASCEPVARERVHRALGRLHALDDERRAAARRRGPRATPSWREQPGETRGPRTTAPSCGTSLAGEQPHQVRLAGAVRPDQPDALAEVDLVVERLDEPVDRDVVRARPRAAPSRRRAAAPGSTGRRRAGAAGRRRRSASSGSPPRRPSWPRRASTCARSLKIRMSSRSRRSSSFQRCEPVAHQRLALLARLAVGRVGAAVHPGAVALERDDRVARRARAASRSWLISRIVFFDARIRSSSALLARGRRGSCPARRAAGSRRRRRTATSSTSCLRSPPDSVTAGRSPTSSRPPPTIRRQAASQAPSSS